RCLPPPDRACAAEPSPGRSMRGDESRQISFFAALLAAGVTQSVSQSAWARDALACGDVGIDPGGRRLQSVWSRSTPCRMRRSCPKADGGEGRRPKQGRCWADRDRRMPAQYPRESMMEGSKKQYVDDTRQSSPAGLIIRQKEPTNLEMPFDRVDSYLTPTELFYIRSHFPAPRIDVAGYQLRIDGAVRNPLTL